MSALVLFVRMAITPTIVFTVVTLWLRFRSICKTPASFLQFTTPTFFFSYYDTHCPQVHPSSSAGTDLDATIVSAAIWLVILCVSICISTSLILSLWPLSSFCILINLPFSLSNVNLASKRAAKLAGKSIGIPPLYCPSPADPLCCPFLDPDIPERKFASPIPAAAPARTLSCDSVSFGRGSIRPKVLADQLESAAERLAAVVVALAAAASALAKVDLGTEKISGGRGGKEGGGIEGGVAY